MANKRIKTRVYLSMRELRALAFLQALPEFKDASPSNIMKTCLMVVAIDAKLKLDEANKKDADEKHTSDQAISEEPIS